MQTQNYVYYMHFLVFKESEQKCARARFYCETKSWSNVFHFFSSQKNGKVNSDSGEKNGTLWPPWRLPTACDPSFTDPRTILHSRFAHGLIFNLLYKGVYGVGSSGEKKECSEQILSLTVFLLELALSFPQTDYSGKVNISIFLTTLLLTCIFGQGKYFNFSYYFTPNMYIRAR